MIRNDHVHGKNQNHSAERGDAFTARRLCMNMMYIFKILSKIHILQHITEMQEGFQQNVNICIYLFVCMSLKIIALDNINNSSLIYN